MNRSPLWLATVTMVLASAGGVQADLIAGQDIIAAPASVLDVAPGWTNNQQQAFNERQGVTLAADLAVDGGWIPSGTVVDSHMIFLNPAVGDRNAFDQNVLWTFSDVVLGVMSDRRGRLERASSAILGAPGTTYPGAFAYRGLERRDSYTVVGNTIRVSMLVSQPGDWMRVITAPAPGSLLLGLLGMTICRWMRRPLA